MSLSPSFLWAELTHRTTHMLHRLRKYYLAKARAQEVEEIGFDEYTARQRMNYIHIFQTPHLSDAEVSELQHMCQSQHTPCFV